MVQNFLIQYKLNLIQKLENNELRFFIVNQDVLIKKVAVKLITNLLEEYYLTFMGPWMDFILAKVIVRAEAEYYTVSIGLYKMLEMEFVNNWFTRFCAGAVVVAIPISILFMITQKCYQEAMGGAVKG